MTQASLKALILFEGGSKKGALSSMTFDPEETYPRIKTTANHATVDIKSRGRHAVSFVNPLPHNKVQLVAIVVNSADVMVSIIMESVYGSTEFVNTHTGA